MEPTENKPTHYYPNADRGDGTTNPSGPTPIGQGLERPLFHLSDVMNNPTDADKTNTPPQDYKTSSVHTFKDDLANEASKGGLSIGKVMAANSKKAHSNEDNTTNIGKKSNHIATKLIVFVVCLLIIGGFSYIGFNSAKTPEQIDLIKNPSQQTVNGILYSEISFPMFVQGKNRSILVNEILKESSIKIDSGKVKSFIFNTTDSTSSSPISAPEFLKIFAPSAPDLLIRNIRNEYVFGYYSYDSNEPFIIFKSSNYDSVFAGMLDWEKSMYADLNDFVFKRESSKPALTSNKSSTSTSATTTSSTTPSTNSSTTASVTKNSTTTKYIANYSLFDTNFVDKIISNNDTRVLYKPDGSIAFFYTFFNKDTIIITTSEQTLKELIYRLTSGKITR